MRLRFLRIEAKITVRASNQERILKKDRAETRRNPSDIEQIGIWLDEMKENRLPNDKLTGYGRRG